ncbi:MAG: hypothetical protein PHT07_10320 [Paludibacter sp.]|nr:hypothetical protein [Paludibacter sp.]
MVLKDIIADEEIIGREAHIRVAESTYIQCIEYMRIAELEGYAGGEIRGDGIIAYLLEEINEELSEGVNDEVPHRLLKMIEKAIKSGADYLVLDLEKSGDVYAA